MRLFITKTAAIIIVIVPLMNTVLGNTSKGRQLVFKETVIEGKIKRPQVVLISADQRPEFKPMAINSFDDTTSLIDKVNRKIFEQNCFENAMKLNFYRK